MATLYLFVNAALYALFAVLCSVRLASTSQAMGYLALAPGGRSEYLAVYGGLQVGLAIAYAWFAWRPELHRTGILFSLALYAPIVLFRWASIARYGPVARVTLATGVLETTLLACAALLWWYARPR